MSGSAKTATPPAPSGELDGGTLSLPAEDTGPGSAAGEAHLFLVLASHALLSPPERLSLAAIDEVLVGRGEARRIERQRGRRLLVRVDDPWMSSAHARLVRALGRWALEDTGSKNGVLVDGAPCARAELADGAVIEIGRTFFVFRREIAASSDDPGEQGPASLHPKARGPFTLLPSLERALARTLAVSRSMVSVLIEGETGTGKEVMARAVHASSGRAGAFVAVNCGALPEALVEGALFGHRKGAFSGATEDRIGFVRSADRGTLFLDEIGDLPLASQATLLRVLQEREVVPVGHAHPLAVDFRVVAATHRPIDHLVEEGGLRADLFNRLAGHRLVLPPLRARREDLGLIVAELLQRLAPDRAARLQIHPRAARALLLYDWPGNVRELEKALEASLALAQGDMIDLEHLPPASQRAPREPAAPPAPRAEDAQRERIAALLREHRGNVSAVARALGKARMQVQRWLKRYELDPESFRSK